MLKTTLISCLIFLIVCQLTYTQDSECQPCSNPPLLPVIGNIGLGKDVLTGENKPPHFIVCCNEGNLTPDHRYSIPDGLGYIYDDWCIGNIETGYAAHYRDYKTEKEKKFTFGITWGAFSFSFSVSTLKAKQKIQYHMTHWTATYSICHIFRGQIYGPKKPQLNPYFVQESNKLPAVYDKSMYTRFISLFGTHTMKYLIAGGELSQEQFTSSGYVQQKSITEVKRQSQISFYVTLSTESRERKELDEQWVWQSFRESINVKGGNPGTIGNTTVAAWMGTVKDAPAIISAKYDNISSLFTEEFMPGVSDIDKKSRNIEQAMTDYVNSFVGCTSASAMNWNRTALIDDGSCIDTNFAGVYQHDTCNKDVVKNWITNGIICPPDQPAQRISVSRGQGNPGQCALTQFVCMGDKPKGIKAYGGGFMACDAPQGNIPNPVTNAINCPAGYRQVLYGNSISNQMKKIRILRDEKGKPKPQPQPVRCSHFMCIKEETDKTKQYLAGGFQVADDKCKNGNDSVRNPITGDYSCLDYYRRVPTGRVLAISGQCWATQFHCIKYIDITGDAQDEQKVEKIE